MQKQSCGPRRAGPLLIVRPKSESGVRRGARIQTKAAPSAVSQESWGRFRRTYIAAPGGVLRFDGVAATCEVPLSEVLGAL